MRRASLLLLLVGLIVAAGVPVSAGPVSAYEPRGWGTFNTPKPWGDHRANFRIVETVTDAIRKTRPSKHDPEPVIRISTFLLDYSPSVKAMIKACRRGVAVRVILDEDIKNWNSRRLITALNADNVRDRNRDGKPDRTAKAGPCNRKLVKPKSKVRKGWQRPTAEPDFYENRYNDGSFSVTAARRSVSAKMRTSATWGQDGSYVKRCDGACRGRGGNMHSKFFLFSRTGKAEDVVMVSSSNINRGGAEMGWNDLFVMKDRPKSYLGYAKIHRQMTNDRRAGTKKVEIKDGKYVSRFFPMRHAGKRNDPVLKDLKRISCMAKGGKTQINVSMFYWKGSRGNYLIDRLVKLARQGCRVSVVYGAPSVASATRLRGYAYKGLIDVYDSRWDFNYDGFNEVRTHAKYVLVKGNVDGDRNSYHVWTGSQNWVAGSLSRGDEVSLNIKSKRAWKQYRGQWRNLTAHSRKVPRL